MKISRMIEAPRRAIYAAFMDPKALAAWLPPAGMRGEMRRFEPWEGGGYRMTLVYDRPSPEHRGKTTTDSDTVEVRFVELIADQRIVQAVAFEADDPAYGGVMTITWSFADAASGTEVSVVVENAPPGIAEADHEVGIRSSLENLARFVA